MAESCSSMILLALFAGFWVCVNAHEKLNYQEALTKSIIFLEAQRSGKLPPTNRVPWRGDSALEDGKLVGVDLVGGYYDAGDNVKFGLPMAFTVTTMAWGAYFYHFELEATGEMNNLLDAIRWGTDYLLKASSQRNRLFVENMKTPRTVLEINDKTPGTEIAGETAAALAASSLAFRKSDQPYADKLLETAIQVFQFADEYRGTFDGACPFYCSYSGFNYMKYILEQSTTATVFEFSWDLKYAGAQVLLSQENNSHVNAIAGGYLNLRDGANSQYVTSTALLFSIYSDLLARHNMQVTCGHNPVKRSMMVGFGNNPPVQAHHRGASVPANAVKEDINCGMSFVYWYNVDTPNPNELTGAILGGPDRQDQFVDKRVNSSYTEPCTYVNACAIGVLAKLAKHHG
ncbi:Glycoside hydrolase, family 9, partial [Cynara cardunculus var. scolymus]